MSNTSRSLSSKVEIKETLMKNEIGLKLNLNQATENSRDLLSPEYIESVRVRKRERRKSRTARGLKPSPSAENIVR